MTSSAPRASLLRNVGANTGSQVFASLLGVLALPFLVSLLGAEAYGIAALFVFLQTWLSVLDFGLGQTLSRQTARLREGAVQPGPYMDLFRTIKVLFFAVGGTLVLLWWLAAAHSGSDWLNADQLNPGTVQLAVQLMGIGVALRWIAGLYRGVLVGHEQFLWLSVLNVLAAVARFVLVLPVLALSGQDQPIVLFMVFQMAVSTAEVIAFMLATRRATAAVVDLSRFHGRFSLGSLRGILGFSLTLTATSVAILAYTQADRVLLSGLLPLADYGVYAVAVVLAGGVTMLSFPVQTAIIPRLTRVAAATEAGSLRNAYVASSALVAWLTAPVAVALAVTAEPLLQLWTSDESLAAQAAPVLALYAVGNLLLAINYCSFMLQFAVGNLRLFLTMSVVVALILIPAQLHLAANVGLWGPGAAWLLSQALTLFTWVPYFHRRFLPGSYFTWLKSVALIPVTLVGLASVGAFVVVSAFAPDVGYLQLAATGLAGGVASLVAVTRLVRSGFDDLVEDSPTPTAYVQHRKTAPGIHRDQG